MILFYQDKNQNHIILTNLQVSDENFFHLSQNNSLQVPCINNLN